MIEGAKEAPQGPNAHMIGLERQPKALMESVKSQQFSDQVELKKGAKMKAMKAVTDTRELVQKRKATESTQEMEVERPEQKWRRVILPNGEIAFRWF
jgi:hypothetical protein